MVDLEDITPHYAETLRRWRANVEAHAEQLADARLRRALPAAVAAVPELLRGGLHRAPDRQRPDRARQAALARRSLATAEPPAAPLGRRSAAERHEPLARGRRRLRPAHRLRRGAARRARADHAKPWLGPAARPTPAKVALRGARRARGRPARRRARRRAARRAAAAMAGRRASRATSATSSRRPRPAPGCPSDAPAKTASWPAARPRSAPPCWRRRAGLIARDRPRRQRRPLVLLHALGTDRHMWDPVIDRLAAERE